MYKIISAVSVMGFLVNVVMAVYLAVCEDFGASVGFGILACVFFILLAITGFYGLKNDDL